ncbi:unnamed protein product [Heterobilharzia americana]|nr:unnamed protein product [Heterobilharzia americana]
MNYLGSPSKNHLSDQKQSDQHEKQKDPSVLLPPITSPSKKSEDSLVRCRIASKSSSTSYSNSSGGGNTRRPLQNLRNVKDTSGLAATRRQIAAIISATKFR